MYISSNTGNCKYCYNIRSNKHEHYKCWWHKRPLT